MFAKRFSSAFCPRCSLQSGVNETQCNTCSLFLSHSKSLFLSVHLRMIEMFGVWHNRIWHLSFLRWADINGVLLQLPPIEVTVDADVWHPSFSSQAVNSRMNVMGNTLKFIFQHSCSRFAIIFNSIYGYAKQNYKCCILTGCFSLVILTYILNIYIP